MSHARYQVRERRQRCGLFPLGPPPRLPPEGPGLESRGGNLLGGAESQGKHTRIPFVNPGGWMGPLSPPETKVGLRWAAPRLPWAAVAHVGLPRGPPRQWTTARGWGWEWGVTPLGEEAKEK